MHPCNFHCTAPLKNIDLKLVLLLLALLPWMLIMIVINQFDTEKYRKNFIFKAVHKSSAFQFTSPACLINLIRKCLTELNLYTKTHKKY